MMMEAQIADNGTKQPPPPSPITATSSTTESISSSNRQVPKKTRKKKKKSSGGGKDDEKSKKGTSRSLYFYLCGINLIAILMVVNALTSITIIPLLDSSGIHGLHGLSSNAHHDPSSSSSLNSEEEEEGPKCVSWPISRRGLPLGLSQLDLQDGSHERCKGMNSLIRDTLHLSHKQRRYNRVKVSKNYTDETCGAWRPSTILTTSRISGKNPAVDHTRQCWTRSADGPYLNFPAEPPRTPLGKSSDLSSKDGLARIVQTYGCVDEEDTCIVPPTYRISDSEADCRAFFLSQIGQQINSGVWVKQMADSKASPTASGFKGTDVVQDFDVELRYPYGRCKIHDPKAPPRIVVQKNIKPYLIKGRSFHVRTYFLYKLASKLPIRRQQQQQQQQQQLRRNQNDNENKNNTTPADPTYIIQPPQGWFIKVGNVMMCAEPYSKVKDKELGRFAVKCNIQAWTEHPNYQKNNHSSTGDMAKPFPSSLQTMLPEDDYIGMMYRIENLFETVANVTTMYHKYEIWNNKNKQQQQQKQSDISTDVQWLHFGVDLLIDEGLRPWIVDVNQCPMNPLFGDAIEDATRNPYVSIWRLLMTHYRRELLGDDRYNENACSHTHDMKELVHRVL